MKYSNILAFALILVAFCITACQNEPTPATEAETAAAKKADYIEANAASPEGSPQELADRSCACYKGLNDLRIQTRAEFQAGDTLAFKRADFDLIEERKKAKACVKKIMESIKADPPTKDAFQEALLKKCPDFATSILLMNKVNWKSLE